MTDDDKKLVDMGDLMERIVGCINNAEHDDEAETLGDAKAYIEAQAAEIARWRECALYDATMDGPVFKGWDRSALERRRLAALGEQP